MSFCGSGALSMADQQQKYPNVTFNASFIHGVNSVMFNWVEIQHLNNITWVEESAENLLPPFIAQVMQQVEKHIMQEGAISVCSPFTFQSPVQKPVIVVGNTPALELPL